MNLHRVALTVGKKMQRILFIVRWRLFYLNFRTLLSKPFGKKLLVVARCSSQLNYERDPVLPLKNKKNALLNSVKQDRDNDRIRTVITPRTEVESVMAYT